jgi:hypothetical protein
MFNHILQLEQYVLCVTISDLGGMVFKLAELKNFLPTLNKKNIVGRKWYYGFTKRHPYLWGSHILNEVDSSTFSKDRVSELCNLLERTAEHKINAIRIYV